ncbi:DUF4293 domain-containing protein [Moheibacter stercoris]|uniref:Heme/copper-type cytochrome/quinol oxidase subunit 4 n=1 Tax=Moheibacter stercoris TaxID=1628251 RepID=A0ABV2LQY9_9FLAO
MIQRKQSIYLFLAGLVSGVSTWVANLWVIAKEWMQPEDNMITLLLFLISAVLSILTIFLFKNRKSQMRLTTVNIVLNILLIGYLAYSLTNLPGGFSDSEKGIGLFVPFISILLLVIANRFIKKDEELVKSVDRFR